LVLAIARLNASRAVIQRRRRLTTETRAILTARLSNPLISEEIVSGTKLARLKSRWPQTETANQVRCPVDMKNSLRSHWNFLGQSGYSIRRGVDESAFTPAELSLLDKYGVWMEALERRSIEPITAAQEHFVQVCRGLAQPVAPFELAWKKLKESREKQQHDAAEVVEIDVAPDDTTPRLWAPCAICRGTGGKDALCLRCRGTGWSHDLRVRQWASAANSQQSSRYRSASAA
jgi:uncharacterized protein YifE (UPF0438 family)